LLLISLVASSLVLLNTSTPALKLAI